MARSSSIYLVKIGPIVVAAFTVKHEMRAACKRWIEKGGNKEYLTVSRIRDGSLSLDISTEVDIPLGDL